MLPTQFGSFDLVPGPDGTPVLLGAGGAGSTYLARHRFLETEAAIKVMGAAVSSQPQSRERFLREARAVARLDHSNVARIQDFGESGGFLFYAMEYCGGGSLAERVAEVGPLPLHDLVTVARQVGEALKSCHSQGFIHRDLKPSNLMLLSRDGPLHVKLIDFGLVLSDAWQETGELVRLALGTPMYASPEQLREEKVDARSDLFSLGMSLWHLALGKIPEPGNAREVLESRLSREPYAGRLPGNLPPAFRQLFESLLEKDPDKRMPSAEAFLDSLARLARDPAPSTPEMASAQPHSLSPFDSQVSSALSQKSLSVPLAQAFKIEHSEGENRLGPTYRAEALDSSGKKLWLQVLKLSAANAQRGIDSVQSNAAVLRKLGAFGILEPDTFVCASDLPAVIFALPERESLLDVLRRNGKLPVSCAVHLLIGVARCCETFCEAGLPLPDVRPAAIFVEKDLSAVLMIPQLVADEFAEAQSPSGASADVVVTMAGDFSEGADSQENLPSTLARLLYRVIAGRECPMAASASVYAYVAIPEISEEGNRWLSKILAGKQKAQSLSGLFQEFLSVEGLGEGSLSRLPLDTARTPDERAPATHASTASQRPIHTHPPRTIPKPEEALVSKRSDMEPRDAGRISESTAQNRVEKPSLPSAPEAVRSSKVSLKWIGLAGAVALVLLVGAALFRGRGERNEPAALLKVRMTSPIPAGIRILVGAVEVKPGVEGDVLSIPLGESHRWPAQIRVEAPGFEMIDFSIRSARELETVREIALARSEGTLVLKATGGLDYENARIEWGGPLPGEDVPENASLIPKGEELSGRSEVVIKLPTGRYKVVLLGTPGRVGIRELEPVEVAKNFPRIVHLPPGFAGIYKRVGGEPGGLKIETDLARGQLSYSVDSTSQVGSLTRLRLDETRVLHATFTAGDFVADLRFTQVGEGQGLNVSVTPRGVLDAAATSLQFARE